MFSKRILFILSSLILSACLVSVTWAQQKEDGRPMNLREIIIHRALSMMPKSASGINIQSFNALANTIELETVYDLGTYPGGTWTQMNDINNDGVAVGAGDIKAGGESRPIGIPLFGPEGFVWFDLGTFSNQATDIGGSCSRISDTGMIVGYAATEQGYQHAFSWKSTPEAKKEDLGTWKSDTCSAANGVNDKESLIVGWSRLAAHPIPVVWTAKVVWKAGQSTTTWQIQRLDTGGLERPGKVIPGVTLNRWVAVAVNDLGQIVGNAYSDPEANGFSNAVPIIWNPIPGGKGWKATLLPLPLEYPHAETFDINNQGEVVGYLFDRQEAGLLVFPAALWKPQSSGRGYSVINLPVWCDYAPFSIAAGINDLGDIVGAEGVLFRTRTHELTVLASSLVHLAKNLLPRPAVAVFRGPGQGRHRRQTRGLLQQQELG